MKTPLKWVGSKAPRSVGAAAASQKSAAELILKSQLDSFEVACA